VRIPCTCRVPFMALTVLPGQDMLANTALGINHLIESLPRADRVRIQTHASMVSLTSDCVLCEPHQRYRQVYFPLTCIISLETTLSGHPPLSLGLIGNGGMLGATLALGTDVASMRAVVRGAGCALSLSAVQMRRELRTSPHLTLMLLHHLAAFMEQLPQSAACAHFHKIEPRLARWLLMTQDCAASSSFYLTHESLASMLGVHRSGVTIAAGDLQRRKLINYSRGMIQILDRPGLEASACECYQPWKESSV